jgi:hypothetical protein
VVGNVGWFVDVYITWVFEGHGLSWSVYLCISDGVYLGGFSFFVWTVIGMILD